MCLLFLCLNDNPAPDQYRVILANVRDEFYNRPTKIANFWQDSPQIIGAIDLQGVPANGTWLAMNCENGKIASLLNILQPPDEIARDKKSRGQLVTEFLLGKQDAQSYQETVQEDDDFYNGFRLVTLQVQPDGHIDAYHHSNKLKDGVQKIVAGVEAFGNNLNDVVVWPKTREGKIKFANLVNRFGQTTADKGQLIDGLFDFLMTSTKRYSLDDQMLAQGRGKPVVFLEKLSSIFVHIPEVRYGSRTWTLILVDADNKVDYIEKTLAEPIPDFESLDEVNYVTNHHCFNLKI